MRKYNIELPCHWYINKWDFKEESLAKECNKDYIRSCR